MDGAGVLARNEGAADGSNPWNTLPEGVIFMRIIYMLPLVAVATCLTAFSQDSSQVPSSDQAFLKEAAAGNLAEIQTGRLAEKKASSPVVKQFGQRMVTDHTKLLDQTKGLASRLNVMLPTSVGE